jgi:hypothetical protein
MVGFTNDELSAAVRSPRFAILSQTGLALGDFNRFDINLIRESRLLVPIDVQALVVRPGDEPMVRLPFRTEGDSLGSVDDPGAPREPGVHLLWSTPAAFGRGKLVDDPTAPGDLSRRQLQLPLLPDRWVVVRTAVLPGSTVPLVRGWVIEADAGTVTPLAEYPVTTNAIAVASPLPADRLTVHVGGPLWSSSYDAAVGRHALHDPLDDLAPLAASGVVGDALTYVVAGWWSDARHDPLDGVGTIFGYHRRLRELRWDDPDHPIPEGAVEKSKRSERSVASVFGLREATRFRSASRESTELHAAVSPFVMDAVAAAQAPAAPTRTTLLHGRIHGVPYLAPDRPDDRPPVAGVNVAFGATGPSVAALLASGAVAGGGDEQAQRDAERLLTAFSSGILDRVENPDAWPDIEQYEHDQEFARQPGGVEVVDHIVDTPSRGTDPGSAARRGRRSKDQFETLVLSDAILWSTERIGLAQLGTLSAVASRNPAAAEPAAGATQPSTIAPVSQAPAANVAAKPIARSVERPAPPFRTPVSPVVAVVGAGRHLQAAERDEADGTLRVRTSDQPTRGMKGLAIWDDLLRSLGSGAVPAEIAVVVREALGEDPYLVPWRAGFTPPAAPGASRLAARAVSDRLVAEAAVNYAYYAGDDTRLSKIVGATVDSASTRQTAIEGLLKHSLIEGVWSHPEGVTMWGQPWRPLFCEWSIEVDLADQTGIAEWQLGEIDFERADPFTGGTATKLSGRSPLVTGAASTLVASIEQWLKNERERDKAGHGLASAEVENAMVGLRDHLAGLDVLSVTLDGIRETLLGLHYDRGVLRPAGDTAGKPLAVALPQLVAAGRCRLVSARLVDAFGRVLDLPVAASTVAARAVDRSTPATLHLRPRLTAPARLHLRLVDSNAVVGDAATAFVDQADPAHQANPVAGFLLPDHIDEALEMFATDGTPLGQLSHDAFSDGVFWEGAPGRTDIGPAAGPLDDPDITRRRLGWFAAALVTADATDRQATPDRPETESPLSALLRAIDTTLWTIDPLGSMGTEHIAGLVGRPIAVVTAQLTLDVRRDIDDVSFAEGLTQQQRAAAYDELASMPFLVRLGAITRGDDGLLGYFVDDDYSKFNVIDKNIAQRALNTGRHRGDLGASEVAVEQPITHPYVVPGGTVTIRSGQTLRLTLLMHPGGSVHITSGLFPRTAVALARDWVFPGLSVMAPSVRCGPLLLDADKVRLPKVAAFPAEQLFTRRDSPGSWRDDPILAATQSAYLPDQASTVAEGWIRIDPKKKGQP